MKTIILFILSLVCIQSVWSQTITRNVQPVAGSFFSNGNINLSATIGETFNATLGNNSNMLTQGYQQPESIDTGVYINLTAFVEGFYLGNSKMQSMFDVATVPSAKTVSDAIQVKLHNSIAPFDLIYSCNALLNTDGTAMVFVPASAIGNSYYVVVKHRNSIETWSATPVAITSSGATYNFSDAANKAFGDNLSNMGNGVFAIYSGDINQDGSVDFNDYPPLDIASSAGLLGYDANDLNGDASVDFNDYPIIDVNSNNGVLSLKP